MLLTTSEVAELLRVHPKHVYRLLRRGLPGRRVGGDWRFVREEVMAWSSGRGPAGQPPAARGGDGRSSRLLAANEDLVLDAVFGAMQSRPGPLMGRVPADSATGIELLGRGEVAAAGFHGGAPPSSAGSVRLVGLHLFDRELGLAFPRRRGAPRLSDLSRLRVASRPPTAGSRVRLDAALRRKGVDGERVSARALTFGSPREVACVVARGDADVGITTRAWAGRLGLGFSRLVDEPYGLLLDAACLADEGVMRLCEAVQSPAFARQVRGVPGCDPRGAGKVSFAPEAGT